MTQKKPTRAQLENELAAYKYERIIDRRNHEARLEELAALRKRCQVQRDELALLKRQLKVGSTDLSARCLASIVESEIPANARADWNGTNHYEIAVSSKDGYWWLEVADVFRPNTDWSSTPEGQRLGKLLDFACSARTLLAECVAKMAEDEAANGATREVANDDGNR